MRYRFLFHMAACCAVVFAACSKSPVDPDPGNKPTPDPEVIELDDLKVNSFFVSPVFNDRIYSDVPFVRDDAGNWRGKIEHYKTDLTKLKASFNAVAANVTVGDNVQVSGETANDFSKPVVYRLYADDGQYKEFTFSLENGTGTGFPIVAIFTDGGKPVDSKEKWVAGRVVIDPQESGMDPLAMAMEIKGRGNNTWRLDKKPYALKLAEKSPVLGMKKHKRWVLLANASDRTLLRNRVAFEIGRCTGLAWTPDSRFAEVILNGKYVGSYLLVEQIKIDRNRVDIAEMTSDDKTGDAVEGGYLLELDRYYDEVNKFRSSFRDLPLNIKEPDADVLVKEQLDYITNYVNEVERMLYENPEAVNMEYKKMIDIDSYIDWWIVVELTGCRDVRLPGSCYMYKDRGGKLCAGPLWDFDLMTFKKPGDFLLYNYVIDDFSNPQGDRSLWYARMFTDPEFKARAGERWRSFKNAQGFDGIAAFIEAEIEKLRPSAEANWAMWRLENGPNEDETLTWEAAAARLRDNYLLRLEWMDKQVSAW